MNRWLIIYDDGATPRTHRVEVDAPTLEEAIQELPAAKVWAACLVGYERVAAAELAVRR